MDYIVVEGNIGAGKSTVVRAVSEWALRRRKNIASGTSLHGGSTGSEAAAPATTRPCFVMEEPLTEWKHDLPDFYADPAKHALRFQLHVLEARERQLHDAFAEITNSSTDSPPPETGEAGRNVAPERQTRFRKSPPLVVLERCMDSGSCVFVPCLVNTGAMSRDDDIAYAAVRQRLDARTADAGYRMVGVIYLDALPETCLTRVRARGRAGEACVDLAYLRALRTEYEKWMRELQDERHVPVHRVSCDGTRSVHDVVQDVLAIVDGHHLDGAERDIGGWRDCPRLSENGERKKNEMSSSTTP